MQHTHSHIPLMFDHWPDPVVHLLLPKSSMPKGILFKENRVIFQDFLRPTMSSGRLAKKEGKAAEATEVGHAEALRTTLEALRKKKRTKGGNRGGHLVEGLRHLQVKTTKKVPRRPRVSSLVRGITIPAVIKVCAKSIQTAKIVYSLFGHLEQLKFAHWRIKFAKRS